MYFCYFKIKMKKYLSLLLVLLFILLPSMTSCTKNERENIEIATVENQVAGFQMQSTMTVYNIGSNGAYAIASYIDKNRYDEVVSDESIDEAIKRTFILPNIDGATNFVTASNNPSSDTRVAASCQVAGEENLGAGKFKNYVYDGRDDYYEDKSSKGIAAISFSFTIPADQCATEQKAAISFEIEGNGFEPRKWAVATSADNYAKVYQGQSKMYVAVNFSQDKESDIVYTVWIWLNGCVATDGVNATNIKFTFCLVPYAIGMGTLPTVEAPTLDTFKKYQIE